MCYVVLILVRIISRKLERLIGKVKTTTIKFLSVVREATSILKATGLILIQQLVES